MADEVLKIDSNNKVVAGFVTDDSNQYIRNARIDDTTKGLKVMLVGGAGSGTVTEMQDSDTNGVAITWADPTTTPQATVVLGDISPSTVTTTEIIATASEALVVRANNNNAALIIDVSGSVQSTMYSDWILNGGTASTILSLDSNQVITSLATSTYPSLTELSYVKGVTSAIQTQLNAKQATITFGTGVETALGVNIGSVGAVVINGGALGTPSSGTLTNATGLPAASVLAGTLGTGAYTMDTSLSVPQVFNGSNAIAASSNAATVTRANRINVVTNDSASTLTITMSTSGASAGDMLIVQVLDASAVAQTITWVNTEDSTVSAPTTSNGSTTLPLTVGFIWNASTSKWRTIASA